MKAIHQFSLFLICTWVSASASALSCVGLSDRFFVECNQGVCNVEFRAREVPSFGSWTRRLAVESVDSKTGTLIAGRIPNKYASRFIEVNLTHRYYGNPPKNDQELDRALQETDFRAPRISIKQLPSGTTLSAIRSDLESQAMSSKLESLTYWSVEIISVLFGVLVLYRSVTVFRKRLTGVNSGNLLTPIAFQVVVLMLAVACLLSPIWLILFGLLAPLSLLVFIFELSAYIRKRIRLANQRGVKAASSTQ
jgi:hypothetical protein